MASFGGENNILILAIALIATLFALFNVGFGRKSYRRSRYRNRSYRSNDFRSELHTSAHFGQQLQSVMVAPFERQRIMNSSEYRAFQIIEEDMASCRNGYRVFAQTSLGEILKSRDEDAFRSINSKRVDILIVDRGGWPVLAVEYQGEGHFKGTAAARDAIKKEALRKAGVGYLEVMPNDSDEKIRRHVREYLGLDATSTPAAKPLHPTASLPSRTGFGLRTAQDQAAITSFQ